MAKIVLILLIALLFAIVARLFARASRISYNPAWHTMLDLAERLTKNSESVRKAITYAMRDRTITSELSQFRLIAEDEFSEHLIDWIDEDTAIDDMPMAVLKTVLHGYGYMAYTEWQNLAEIEELFIQYNRVAETWELPIIGDDTADTISAEFKATADFNKAISGAIGALNEFTKESDRELLWLDDGESACAFFITTESNAKALMGQAIDSKHSFTAVPTIG